MRIALTAVALVAVCGCSSTPPAADAGSCSLPRIACASGCADLALDDANCGACGRACPSEEACAGSACRPRTCANLTCGQGQVCVDTVCVDRTCFGVVCPAGEACASGVCYPRSCAGSTCRSDQLCVGGACVTAACVGVICPAGLRCAAGACAADTCADGVPSGDETAVDCGGPVCPPCPPGAGCRVPRDCTSLSCDGGICRAPACSDGVRNGTESDHDCGGACPGCDDGRLCRMPGDCASGACDAGTCAAATCSDGVANGNEADTDCGAACPLRCAAGQSCGAPADCQSSACAAGRCVSGNCLNQVLDGDETDLDCGGTCAGCAAGLRCDGGSDCLSFVCTPATRRCAAATCFDVVKNGTESATDCGGACTGCAPGQACRAAMDCTSGVCASLVCAAPACTDGVRNGGESDADCGGTTQCMRCAPGRACVAGTDCASPVCDGGTCAPAPLLVLAYSLPVGVGPVHLEVTDIDGDGRADVAVADYTSFDIQLFYGEADGGFAIPTALQVSGLMNTFGPSAVTFADVTGDGLIDAVTARPQLRYCYCNSNCGNSGYEWCVVSLYRGLGGRQFVGGVDSITSAPGLGCGYTVAAARLDGTAGFEVVVGDELRNHDCTIGDNVGGLTFTFDAGIALTNRLAQLGPYVITGDVDLDGKADVLGRSVRNSRVRVLRGVGDGGFHAPVDFGVSPGSGELRLGFVNADGFPDVVVASKTAGVVGVALGVGDGSFLAPNSTPVAAPDGIGIADFTGDMIADVVVGGTGLVLLEGRGDGSFLPAVAYGAALGDVGDVGIGDFNADGKPDVACIAQGRLQIFFGARP